MTFQYQGRTVRVLGHYDTVIVGGGMAGAPAAIMAARGQNKTLIVEKHISLGGTAVSALVNPMMPSGVQHGTVFKELEERMNRKGMTTRDQVMNYVWYTPEMMAEVLEEMYTEAGGEILYDACLTDCITENGNIKSILVSTVEGYLLIEAEQFVDATGDAVLSRLAGVPVTSGDENGNNQMSSLRFEMGGIQVEQFRDYCLSLQDEFSPLKTGYFWESAMVAGKNFKLEPLFRKGVEEGILQEEDLRYFQCFSLPSKEGCMSFNCPHIASLKQNTGAMQRSAAITEGRQMMHRLVRFLIRFMPGFTHAYLAREASMLGIRESYRITGKYILTEEDYGRRARFPDAIAGGDWYIDVHSASKGLVHMDKFQPGEYYEIPYRCLINEQISNLITVGRCISTTFLMQASVRIIPTVIDMGEAAGKACVLAHKDKIFLNAVSGERISGR